MAIFIENNIPLPTRAPNKARADKYPIAQLNVGDSFYAPIGKNALAVHGRRAAKILQRKFVTRTEGEGARIWRKA